MIRFRHTILCIALLAAAAAGAESAAPARELSLAEALRMAAARSLPLERQRLSRQQAALSARAAEAVYWPSLSFALGYGDERLPGDGGDPAVERGTFSYDMGVDWTSPLGTDVGLSLTNHRRNSSDADAAPDPEHAARIELGVSQPLLRGLGLGVQLASLERARLAHQVAVEDFRARLNSLLRDVEHAYWELALSQQDVVVKQRSLERAAKQHKDTAENIRRGLLPEHDIYVVEENLVSFQRRLLSAQQNLAEAQLKLAEGLQLPPEEAGGLRAAERPEAEGLQAGELPTLLERAVRFHPELRAVLSRLASARIDLRLAENARLPGVNLDAALRLNGVTESPGASWERLGEGDDRELFVGLRMDLPLFDTLDDSLVAVARIELKRRSLELEQVEQALRFAVRREHRAILHARESLQLARRVSELAKRKLEAQQEKYKAGVAALKDLVQFLRELDEAEIEQERERVRLAKAVCDLHVAVGDLHSRFGIEVR